MLRDTLGVILSTICGRGKSLFQSTIKSRFLQIVASCPLMSFWQGTPQEYAKINSS